MTDGIQPQSLVDLSRKKIFKWLEEIKDVGIGYMEDESFFIVPKHDVVIYEQNLRGTSKFFLRTLRWFKEHIEDTTEDIHR